MDQASSAKENPQPAATGYGSKKTNTHEGFKMTTNVSLTPQETATGSGFEAFLIGVYCPHTDKRECGRRTATFERRHRGVSVWRAIRSSSIKPTQDGGKLVRYFGHISFHEASRSMRVIASADATPAEVEKLLVTALHHSEAGTAWLWDKHPCRAGQRTTSVCRYVDEQYLSEVLTAVLELGDEESVSWRSGEQVAA